MPSEEVVIAYMLDDSIVEVAGKPNTVLLPIGVVGKPAEESELSQAISLYPELEKSFSIDMMGAHKQNVNLVAEAENISTYVAAVAMIISLVLIRYIGVKKLKIFPPIFPSSK